MTSPQQAVNQKPGTAVTRLEPGDHTGHVQRTVLPSGIKVVTERLPGVASVQWTATTTYGSRHERTEWRGSAHFLAQARPSGRRWKALNPRNRIA